MNLKMDSGNRVHFLFFIVLSQQISFRGNMIRINPESINDLLVLKEAGIPVTMTSHPGNASLYKLVLWSCGIPEHLWDVTCCKADANNWPMYRLIDGKAELLITEELHRKIVMTTNPNNRFVTAYQFTKDAERLGRFHVRVKQQCFPDAISSCSRLLLSEKEKIWEMFDYLARTRKNEVFDRFITPDGLMRPTSESGIIVEKMADSFIRVLEELDHLLFLDTEIVTKGGICYGGVMVPLSGMLVQYWQTGRADRYDISGPDMIHYATRPEHQKETSEMLAHLRKWNPKLVPENILVHMFPGTVARVAHIKGHKSEEVMRRKVYMLEHSNSLDRERKAKIWETAKEDEFHWPIQIKPNIDRYFSQHDLLPMKDKFVVDEFWKNIPIVNMRETLSRANNLLRL